MILSVRNMDIYRKKILEHYKNPRNFGKLKGRSRKSHGENPSCGDSITLDVLIENGVIKDIKFSGEGCAIAIASASMLSEKVMGMRITEIADIEFSDIEEMLGIDITPARKRCAMLSLNILKKIILKELKES